MPGSPSKKAVGSNKQSLGLRLKEHMATKFYEEGSAPYTDGLLKKQTVV